MGNEQLNKEAALQREASKKPSKKLSNVEMYLAAHPEIQEHKDKQDGERLKTLRDLQTQVDFIYNQEKKIKDLQGDSYNLDGSRNEQLNTITQLTNQINGVVKSSYESPKSKAPGTVSIGEGDNQIELSEDRLNKMLNDPAYMDQELKNMPPNVAGQVTDYLGIHLANDTLQQPQEASAGQDKVNITPVPSNQVGGEDSLKSTIKNFLTQFGTGGAPKAVGETVANISNQARSATRKGVA